TAAGRQATVLGWLERFPAGWIRDDVDLGLASAWMLEVSGRHDACLEAIAAVERMGDLDQGPLPDGFPTREASLVTLKAVFAWGDVGSGLANSRRAVELIAADSVWRPVACYAMGIALYASGELDEADRFFAEAAELAPACEQWRIAVVALAYRSF